MKELIKTLVGLLLTLAIRDCLSTPTLIGIARGYKAPRDVAMALARATVNIGDTMDWLRSTKYRGKVAVR